jgi:hypothetical protein
VEFFQDNNGAEQLFYLVGVKKQEGYRISRIWRSQTNFSRNQMFGLYIDRI